MSLTLAASASEQRRAKETLRNQVEELAALNDASRLFLENTEKQTLADAICRLAVDRFGLPAVWINPIPVEEKLANPLAVYPAYLQSDGQLAELYILIPELRQRILEAGRTGLAGVFPFQSLLPTSRGWNFRRETSTLFCFLPAAVWKRTDRHYDCRQR